MATLVKVKTKERQDVNAHLLSSVPAPFPRERLQVNTTNASRDQPVVKDHEPTHQLSSSHMTEESDEEEKVKMYELMPSIVNVERTLLMTLNNLLSVSHRWKTIVPERRHSMPNSPQSSTTPRIEFESTSSALQTLVSNLRSRTQDGSMEEVSSAQNDTELINELRSRVDDLSSTLEPSDAELTRAVIMLLSHLNRLSIILSASPSPSSQIAHLRSFTALNASSGDNVFDTLKRQLSDFQFERLTSSSYNVPSGSKPVITVEAALLWTRIDEELETVVSMCRERTEQLPRFSADNLPPQYDAGDHDEKLPEYDSETRLSLSYDGEKPRPQATCSPIISAGQGCEKRRLDFEAVTMAIDRLYLVAPQLHNQRVELKSSKLAQMERARKEGTQSIKLQGKQKEQEGDTRDLERMLELIGKASDRTLKDQSVILDGGMKSRLDRARVRDNEKREAFVSHLAEHSSAGRLHDQDAVLQPIKVKDPNALLTLPEFIKEAMPMERQQLLDPQALLTLPEFVKEMPPPHILAKMNSGSASPPSSTISRLKKKNRDRSSSAPPLSLSWLRSSSSKSSLHEIRTSNSSSGALSSAIFETNHLAEYHENLHHILVFFTVNGAQPGVDIEAEVVPSSPLDDGDKLVIKSGPNTSLPLLLPGRVTPGKKEVKVQSGHYEIKLATLPSPRPLEHRPLLDATQLSEKKPTSFICASCSLPLVHSSKGYRYRDLPSEHWEELVDAWMCHSAQKLHEDVTKRSKEGFWPEPSCALVGGSYILFEESAINKDNVHIPEATTYDEGRHVIRCICGAIIGRYQEHQSDNAKIRAYRVLKYAVRSVSPIAEPSRIPLSAFVVEDMTEFVQAHASYRFVLSDEEEERPRILIWLFKPSMQIGYTAQRPYAIPKSASITVAKVLFKLLGPSDAKSDIRTILSKYPGFPQAEYLYYPMDACQRLAALLKESNMTYPESMRVMTGLDVGWLQRM
ncbi:hypothetical protein E1B28_006163 [Marasmius oreades]|uniref:Uncharacterized protein n=1 Tax=Marasmius oreades TaxID=181124 RepID=A0A9P7S4S7_9AGAR|nr:uncharacterized protein E1B28_006163 [Marasmius oreades]KAG7095414.1 hypothetical protein E1B28_006163 [Marasmius oreades]